MSDAVDVQIDAGGQSVRATLREGEAVLLGRAPSIATLPPGARPDGPLRLLPIEVDQVSRNQVILEFAARSLRVRDLHGRGRTWVCAPRGGLVSVDAPREVALRFSFAASDAEGLPSIDDAEWRDRDNFGAAVEHCLRAWLDEVGVQVEVVRSSVLDAPEGASGLPLEDGSRLHIRPVDGQTQLIPWAALQDRMRAWLHEQNVRFRDEGPEHHEHLVLVSSALRRAHGAVVEAARRGLPVVILGPHGVGKRQLALCAWSHSHRAWKEFEEVACAQRSREAAHARLFGAAPGALEGRSERLQGAVERANGGVVFLDEVDALDPATQYALLRFLETREYEPLGGGHRRFSDVHMVCASVRDLRAEVQRGAFREDLWYRLAGRVVEVPPLRDRPEDVDAFLQARSLSAGCTAFSALSPEARQFMRRYAWPGGFRELSAALARLPHAPSPGSIDPEACHRAIAEGSVRAVSPPPPEPPPEPPHPPTWVDVAARAARAYARDQGDLGASEVRWSESVRDYVERYLKPLTVARLLDLEAIRSAEEVRVSFQELAGRIGIADGGTVKKFIEQYVASFRRG